MRLTELLNEYFFGIAVPAGLILTGLFYCVKLKGFHIFHPVLLIRSLFERSGQSGVSPLRAVTLALAGTLGVGNIVGVASAIYLGGAGAVLWMWISALCAMVLKYAEIVLAVRHRRTDKNGNFFGGAAYYIRDFFVSRDRGAVGAVLAAAFAALCAVNALSMGAMIQSNAVASAFAGVCDVSPVTVGALMALVTATVSLRGTRAIVRLTDALVPIMSLGYAVISMAVIAKNAPAVPTVLGDIVSSAFNVDSAAAGIFGFFASGAIRYGAMRGLLSNEAGCGTAPTAHAVSCTDSAARQGIWGIFEVFVDTIVLCSMTALVILLGYDSASAHGGNFIMMTFSAYSRFLGGAAEIFMCAAVLLFGFATIICWAHYGSESVRYLSSKKRGEGIFIFIYSASVFLGAVMSGGAVWQVADLAIGAMTLINLFVLVGASCEVREETDLFVNSKMRKKTRIR